MGFEGPLFCDVRWSELLWALGCIISGRFTYKSPPVYLEKKLRCTHFFDNIKTVSTLGQFCCEYKVRVAFSKWLGVMSLSGRD